MRELLRFHGRRLGTRLLRTSWFVGNPIFRAVVWRRIRRRIGEVDRGAPPKNIVLESSSVCNARCIMCPHPSMRRPKGFMDMTLCEKALHESRELGVPTITAMNFGEPLLDEHLGERIRRAKSLGLHVELFTNGSLLCAEKAQVLLESGLDELKISIDSLRKSVYEGIRKGLRFEEVTQNVRDFIALRRRTGKATPRVWVMFVELERNRGETGRFFRYWSRIVDRVNIGRSSDWARRVRVRGKTILGGRYRFPCPQLWTQLVVNSQGGISACCVDYEGDSLVLGNIRDTSLREAWEGERLSRMRQKHLEQRYSELPLCADCSPNDIWA